MDQETTPPAGEQPPQSSEAPPPPPSYQPPAPPPPPAYQPPAGAPPPPPQIEVPVPVQFQAPVGGYTTGVTAKNPVLSLVLSLVIPGLGQIINGETGKGIALIVGVVISFFLIFVLIGFLTWFAIWVFAMYDAFQGAKKWNVAHGFPPGA
jgi:TM2 domain-containing membrane protein YozV